MPESLNATHYTESHLLMGGALVFCAAVVIQLLPVSEPTKALRLALWAAAVAIPGLAATIWVYAAHEGCTIHHANLHLVAMGVLSLLASLACATAVFWHFSEALGIGFIVISSVAIGLVEEDNTHHQRINTPEPSDAAE